MDLNQHCPPVWMTMLRNATSLTAHASMPEQLFA
jgi:hypothetical protein